MDILVISWNYPPRRGGIENVVENLCRALRSKHRVFVVTAFQDAPHAPEPDTFRAPLPGLIPFAVYALWRGAAILARNRQVRIVLGGSALVTPLVLILARVFRRRAIILTHGLDVIHQNFLYQLLCVRWLKFCDRVFANSRYTAGLVRSKAVDQRRVVVIPPGIHPQQFAPAGDAGAIKERLRLQGRRIILFVGRLAKRKGVKEFIQHSLADIVRELPDVCFVVVGDDLHDALAERAQARTAIQAVVAQTGLQDHVRLLGALSEPELAECYRACDLVVLPAVDVAGDGEGFGIVLIEAAAAGKAAVATRLGGIPDAIAAGETGVLVTAGDYTQLTRSIVSLLNDESARLAMGERGSLRARESFCWSRIVEEYERALHLR
jgi:phosphatidylinositol alpha-1,6-mannosyltransferase